jgi:hypothetical protein
MFSVEIVPVLMLYLYSPNSNTLLANSNAQP